MKVAEEKLCTQQRPLAGQVWFSLSAQTVLGMR